MVFVHDTADVNPRAELGKGCKVWNLAQIRENARLGANCIVSKNVYIDFEVVLGDNCKIQNNSSIYHGARIADGVFIGPHCALLNDPWPRAINADGSQKSADDWTVAGVTVGKGAALGGGTIARPGVNIGAWAITGAGSLVSRDLPDHALAYGNPARVMGFVDFDGNKMEVETIDDDGVHLKSKTGFELTVPQAVCRYFLDR